MSEKSGQIKFFGCESAELFTRQVTASFHGVLTRNMVTDLSDPMVGFASASIDGRPWTGTMWTRDAGVFLRELAQWGYFEHACLLADNLITLVQQNDAGYYAFPERFDRGMPGSGTELDGTGAIVIGMVLLYERLPEAHLTRNRIRSFLFSPASPLAYFENRLEHEPLLSGSGEFGGGVGTHGEFYNVVQNNLVRLACLAVARVAPDPERYRRLAEKLSENMHRYLRDDNGAWIWCIDASTLQADPRVVNSIANKGFGGLNAVLSMSCDVQGFEPATWRWNDLEVCQKTFDTLLAFLVRRAMFDKYGAWTQFDDFGFGYFTGPSYGHGYALQNMLLTDRMEMAGRALDWLAQATHTPPRGNVLNRDNEDYFYERYYLPELSDYTEEQVKAKHPFFPLHVDGHLDEGCGALNLVCVAEPLKIARMVVGIDDSSPAAVRIIPRLPATWTGYDATHWPILTPDGVKYADIHCRRTTHGMQVDVRGEDGKAVPNVSVKES